MILALRSFVVLGCFVALEACVRVPKQTKLQERMGGDVSATLMRARVFELGRRALSTIQESADSIRNQSTEPAVLRNGLLWKINSGPAFQEAALQPDPLWAAAESYVLIEQMHGFFETGDGRNAFANCQPIALNALKRLQDEAILTLALGFAGDSLPNRVRERLTQWAVDHPVRTISFRRPALSPDWPILNAGLSPGLGATVSRLDQALTEISQRLAFADENLMKQLTWHLQLLAGTADARLPLDSALVTGRAALVGFTQLADTLPGLMDRERLAVLANVDSQRVATLLALREERRAILDGLDRERAALTDDLRGERIATTAAMDSMIVATFERSDRLVDRIALRAAQVLLLILAATVGAVMVVRFAGGRHGRNWLHKAA